jgi:hypothetical protein
MKKYSLLLTIIFLISIGSCFQQVTAQDKTKEDLDKEQKIQQEILQQKKAMLDQMKALEESKDVLKNQESELADSVFSIQLKRNSGKAGDAFRYFNQRGNRSLQFAEPFDLSTPGGAELFYGHGLGGDSERSTWEFSKSMKGKTFSKEYSFDVEKTSNTVVMSVMGDCKTGDIRIKIYMPTGKSYSDIVIDESGNLNWRKSFTISETENQDKAGEWKFKIDSDKATGFFKISLQTY